MTTTQLRQSIESALNTLERGPLLPAATRLFAVLGYRSERRIELDDTSGTTFAAQFDRDGRLAQRAMLVQWRSVEMLFQLSSEEINQSLQMDLFAGQGFEPQLYRSFLFFAIELHQKPDGIAYTRSELATITREVNRLFTMPVSVLFRFPQPVELNQPPRQRLTLAVDLATLPRQNPPHRPPIHPAFE